MSDLNLGGSIDYTTAIAAAASRIFNSQATLSSGLDSSGLIAEIGARDVSPHMARTIASAAHTVSATEAPAPIATAGQVVKLESKRPGAKGATFNPQPTPKG